MHPDGGPAVLDGHDGLEVLGRAGLAFSSLVLCDLRVLRVLFGLVLGVFLFATATVWSATVSPKRLSAALRASDRDVSVPFSLGMISPLLAYSLTAFTCAFH